MEKYSVEWKNFMNERCGGWAQKHGDVWKWHYINHGTEYSKGEHFTKADCEKENQKNGGAK